MKNKKLLITIIILSMVMAAAQYIRYYMLKDSLDKRLEKEMKNNQELKSRCIKYQVSKTKYRLMMMEDKVKIITILMAKQDKTRKNADELIRSKNIPPERMVELEIKARELSRLKYQRVGGEYDNIYREIAEIGMRKTDGEKVDLYQLSRSKKKIYLEKLKKQNAYLLREVIVETVNAALKEKRRKELDKVTGDIRNILDKKPEIIKLGLDPEYQYLWEFLLELLQKEPFYKEKISEDEFMKRYSQIWDKRTPNGPIKGVLSDEN